MIRLLSTSHSSEAAVVTAAVETEHPPHGNPHSSRFHQRHLSSHSAAASGAAAASSHSFDADLIIRRAHNALDVEMAGLRQVRQSLGTYRTRTAAAGAGAASAMRATISAGDAASGEAEAALLGNTCGPTTTAGRGCDEGEEVEGDAATAAQHHHPLTAAHLARWAKSCDTICPHSPTDTNNYNGGDGPLGTTPPFGAPLPIHAATDVEQQQQQCALRLSAVVREASSSLPSSTAPASAFVHTTTAALMNAAHADPTMPMTGGGGHVDLGLCLISQSTNPPSRSLLQQRACGGKSLATDATANGAADNAGAVAYGEEELHLMHSSAGSECAAADRFPTAPEEEDDEETEHILGADPATGALIVSTDPANKNPNDDADGSSDGDGDGDDAAAALELVTREDFMDLAISDKGTTFVEAVKLCFNCTGRVVVVGMGKSGHVGRKIAATLASTGTPSFFLHAAEASHGDLGMVTPTDVVLALSNSGETPELVAVLPIISRVGARLIAITGNASSTLGRAADAVLDCRVDVEACPLNLSPTASSTAQLALGDALAVVLLQEKGFTAADFALRHPGGALGKRLLLTVADVMRKAPDAVPMLLPSAVAFEALLAMSAMGASAAIVLHQSTTTPTHANTADAGGSVVNSVNATLDSPQKMQRELSNTSFPAVGLQVPPSPSLTAASASTVGRKRGGQPLLLPPRQAAAAAIASSVRSMVARSPRHGGLSGNNPNPRSSSNNNNNGSIGGGGDGSSHHSSHLNHQLYFVQPYSHATDDATAIDEAQQQQPLSLPSDIISNNPKPMTSARHRSPSLSQRSVAAAAVLPPCPAAGVFTDADVRRAMAGALGGGGAAASASAIGARPIAELMSRRFLTIRASALAADAADLLRHQQEGGDGGGAAHHQCIVVLDDSFSTIVGLVTPAEIKKAGLV